MTIRIRMGFADRTRICDTLEIAGQRRVAAIMPLCPAAAVPTENESILKRLKVQP
jgi:hypothetical protein